MQVSMTTDGAFAWQQRTLQEWRSYWNFVGCVSGSVTHQSLELLVRLLGSNAPYKCGDRAV
jgi:hypothetical protein